MKTISIFYWMGSEKSCPGLKYNHKQTFEYSVRKRNLIVNNILAKGYHVMLVPSTTDETLVILIDNWRFRSR